MGNITTSLKSNDSLKIIAGPLRRIPDHVQTFLKLQTSFGWHSTPEIFLQVFPYFNYEELKMIWSIFDENRLLKIDMLCFFTTQILLSQECTLHQRLQQLFKLFHNPDKPKLTFEPFSRMVACVFRSVCYIYSIPSSSLWSLSEECIASDSQVLRTYTLQLAIYLSSLTQPQHVTSVLLQTDTPPPASQLSSYLHNRPTPPPQVGRIHRLSVERYRTTTTPVPRKPTRESAQRAGFSGIKPKRVAEGSLKESGLIRAVANTEAKLRIQMVEKQTLVSLNAVVFYILTNEPILEIFALLGQVTDSDSAVDLFQEYSRDWVSSQPVPPPRVPSLSPNLHTRGEVVSVHPYISHCTYELQRTMGMINSGTQPSVGRFDRYNGNVAVGVYRHRQVDSVGDTNTKTTTFTGINPLSSGFAFSLSRIDHRSTLKKAKKLFSSLDPENTGRIRWSQLHGSAYGHTDDDKHPKHASRPGDVDWVASMVASSQQNHNTDKTFITFPQLLAMFFPRAGRDDINRMVALTNPPQVTLELVQHLRLKFIETARDLSITLPMTLNASVVLSTKYEDSLMKHDDDDSLVAPAQQLMNILQHDDQLGMLACQAMARHNNKVNLEQFIQILFPKAYRSQVLSLLAAAKVVVEEKDESPKPISPLEMFEDDDHPTTGQYSFEDLSPDAPVILTGLTNATRRRLAEGRIRIDW